MIVADFRYTLLVIAIDKFSNAKIRKKTRTTNPFLIYFWNKAQKVKHQANKANKRARSGEEYPR